MGGIFHNTLASKWLSNRVLKGDAEKVGRDGRYHVYKKIEFVKDAPLTSSQETARDERPTSLAHIGQGVVDYIEELDKMLSEQGEAMQKRVNELVELKADLKDMTQKYHECINLNRVLQGGHDSAVNKAGALMRKLNERGS